MRGATTVASRTLVAAALFAAGFGLHPALAQGLRSGDGARFVGATHAAKYARYYAPYAFQAAASYVPLLELDATRGTAGADTARVITAVSSQWRFVDTASEKQFVDRAKELVQAWRYQFGSDEYLLCLDHNDLGCQQFLNSDDRWTRRLSGGPTFHVWARTRSPATDQASCSEVSIAFRGSTASWADWISNADSAAGYVYDTHYRQLRRNIGAIIRRITGLPCYRRGTQIVSVGHSLGAGLAQMAALANTERTRIAKVFAFNPSPVTGASYIKQDTLTRNARRLEIDRVHQNGEVLNRYLRATQQFPVTSHQCHPLVRTVAYELFQPASSTDLHGMAGMAQQLVEVTYNDGGVRHLPQRATNCRTRYRVPAADEAPSPVSPGSAPLISHAPSASPVALAQADRDRMIDRDVRANMFGTADLQTAGATELLQAKPVRLARTHKRSKTAARTVRMARH